MEMAEVGPEDVGDCFSLLARTHFVARRINDAWSCARDANELIPESEDKDYLDLCILLGDLEATKDRTAAESFYNKVLAQQHPGDAERSEIFARAFLSRGANRALRGRKDAAIEDFRAAATISRAIADHSRAARAEWAIRKVSGDLSVRMANLLESEPPQIRSAALVLYDADVGAESANVLSRRQEPTDEYLALLIKRARERVAIEEPNT